MIGACSLDARCENHNCQHRNIEIKWYPIPAPDVLPPMIWYFIVTLNVCDIGISCVGFAPDLCPFPIGLYSSRLSSEIYQLGLVSQFTHKTGSGKMYETDLRWNTKLPAPCLFKEAFTYSSSWSKWGLVCLSNKRNTLTIILL